MRGPPTISSVLARALVALAGVAAALLALELGLRLHPPLDLPLNDPYQLTRLVGTREFRVPLHTYREIYPLRFDHDGYYARSDGAIDYDFDQDGGRWIAPRARDLRGDVALVVGDSFTLGFGLRYQDAYVYRTEQALQARGRPRHFVNFAEPGADATSSLRTYRAVRDRQPHDLVLFGLHLNDLIRFPTSSVAMAAWGGARPDTGSRLLDFVRSTLARRADRAAKIRELLDPAQLEQSRFRDNMAAIEAMQRESAAAGRRFAVVILPILVDLRAGTFAPLYAAVRRALDARGIASVDLTRTLDGERDASLWILPFDQHPNERANAVFADRLTDALLPEPAAPGSGVVGGVRRRSGAQGDGARGVADPVDGEVDHPLGAAVAAGARRVQVDAAAARELQHVAAGEVDEEQAGARRVGQVAEGLEHPVAGVVRPGEMGFVDDVDEARIAAPVRGIEADAGVLRGDEEGVGAGDAPLLRRRQRRRAAGRAAAGGRGRAQLALLDVLGTVAEHLADGDADRLRRGSHHPVDAQPLPGREVEDQRPEGRADDEIGGQRVAGERRRRDLERVRVGGGEEAGRAGYHRRPHPTAAIAAGQHREELPGHEFARPRADLGADRGADLRRHVRRARLLLHGVLAFVERVGHRRDS